MFNKFSVFKNKHSIAQLSLSSLFINLLSLALPFAMLQIYDRILPNQSHGTATVLVVGVAIAIIIEMFLRYGRSWLLASSAADFEITATIDVVKKLMTTSQDSLEKMGEGNILNGLTSISSMRDLYSGQAIVSLMDVPFVFIFLGLVAYIGGPLVFIPIIVWCLVFGLVFFISKTLFQMTQELSDAEAEHSRLLFTILSGGSGIKSYGLETKSKQYYTASNYNRLELQQRVDWLSAKLQELIQGASQMTTLALVIIGALAVLNGTLTTGGLAACSILAGRAVAPLSALVNLRSRYIAAKSAMKNVSYLTESPEEEFTGKKVYQQKLPLGPIRFEGVSKKVTAARVENLNFELQPGSLTSIISYPVADANLILSSIAHFYSLDKGTIYIDGVALGDHQRQEFKQSVLYVSAWPKIFSGSILNNMTMFRPELESAALELAKKLGLDAYASRLPAGYATKVATSGAHLLNQGAIKSIALIRAIVQEPSILLLSEPIVSLDLDGQGRFIELLKSLKGEMTIVMQNQSSDLANIADNHIAIDQEMKSCVVKSVGGQ